MNEVIGKFFNDCQLTISTIEKTKIKKKRPFVQLTKVGKVNRTKVYRDKVAP